MRLQLPVEQFELCRLEAVAAIHGLARHAVFSAVLKRDIVECVTEQTVFLVRLVKR